MVSFQCDGCSDVVKKPKLDNHRNKCNASFTCIDCSVTFNGPAEYKGHTTCMTEAEKYQGSLYKGPKRNDTNRNSKSQIPVQNDDANATQMGKYHSPNPRYNNSSRGSRSSWGRPQPRWEATGANGTPLGTPVRMSPVSFAEPEAASVAPAKKDAPVAVADKKEQIHVQPDDVKGGSRKKKSKISHTPIVSETASTPVAEKKEKKSKEKKRDGEVVAESSKSVEKKERKKSKKGKEVADEKSEVEAVAAENKKHKKTKDGEVIANSEKSKKRKREVLEDAVELGLGTREEEGKKNKKSRKNKEDTLLESSEKVISDMKEKKHKKSKSKDAASS